MNDEDRDINEDATGVQGSGDDAETGQPHDELVRRQSFDTDGPVELVVESGTGPIEIRLVDEPAVHVEVRHDPTSGNPLARGVTDLVNWVTGQFGEPEQEGLAAEAVRRTRIDLTAGRLVVRTPTELQFRGVPVSVMVVAPAESTVATRTGSGDTTVTGPAGALNLATGSGRLTGDSASGPARINSGSGAVQLGAMAAGVRAKTGSGDIEITGVGGPSMVTTGTGDVWLGSVSGDILVRSGSGSLTVAGASAGDLELQTGAGSIKVGVTRGSPAEIDLESKVGHARSELTLTDQRPEATPALRVRGRTGVGSAVVTTATE